MADPITDEQIAGLKADIITVSEVVESTAFTTITKNGLTIKTLNGQLNELGFLPPIAYAGAISFTVSDNRKTVERLGIIYAPIPSELPFTTSGTWGGDDETKFTIVPTNGDVKKSDPNTFTALQTFEADTAAPGTAGVEITDASDATKPLFVATGDNVEIREGDFPAATPEEKRGLKLWVDKLNNDFVIIYGNGGSGFLMQYYEAGVFKGTFLNMAGSANLLQLLSPDSANQGFAEIADDFKFSHPTAGQVFSVNDVQLNADGVNARLGYIRLDNQVNDAAADAFYAALGLTPENGELWRIANRFAEYNDIANALEGNYKIGGYYDQSTTQIANSPTEKITSIQGAIDYIAGTQQSRIAAAWVSFDGQTGVINDSQNVTSVTVNGADSDYTITFTDPLTNSTSGAKFPTVIGSAEVVANGELASFGLHQDYSTDINDNSVRVVLKKDNGDYITAGNRPTLVTVLVFATWEAD